MSDVYRRCSECDYYTRASQKKADRSLADHQRSAGHVGNIRAIGDLTISTADTGAP